MKISLHRAAAVAIGVTLASPGARAADTSSLMICNKTATPVNVSVGYMDPKLGWTSEGWWVAPAGGCTKNLFRGTNKVFYYYAHNAERVIWGGEGSADSSSFCTSAKAFTDRYDSHRIAPNSYDCEKAGLNKRKFRKVVVSGAKVVNLRADQKVPQVSEGPATPPPSGVVAPAGPTGPSNTACQRYPTLC